MRVFTPDQCPQGSPDWWSLRRGIPTASSFDRIITAVKMGKSSQWEDYATELARDIASQSPHWFSERMSRPPNPAIEEGIRREGESRRWLEVERDCSVQLVGFCLHDNGMWGCSPDGLLFTDTGYLSGTLELKNPQWDTQARYLLHGTLPSEYRAQCAGHLIVTGLPRCTFLSYHPEHESLLVEVLPDAFSAKLEALLTEFTAYYLEVLDKLHLRNRFDDVRASVLAHYPTEERYVPGRGTRLD